MQAQHKSFEERLADLVRRHDLPVHDPVVPAGPDRDPGIHDQPDPAIGNIFQADCGCHFEMICFEPRDLPAIGARAVMRRSAIDVADTDFLEIEPGIVPEFQEKFVALQHRIPTLFLR